MNIFSQERFLNYQLNTLFLLIEFCVTKMIVRNQIFSSFLFSVYRYIFSVVDNSGAACSLDQRKIEFVKKKAKSLMM